MVNLLDQTANFQLEQFFLIGFTRAFSTGNRDVEIGRFGGYLVRKFDGGPYLQRGGV